jgi:competence protein ComEA
MFRLTRREQLTIGALALGVAVVVVGVTLGRSQREPGVAVNLEALNAQAPNNVQRGEAPGRHGATIVVHVAGEVERQGTYELPQGARVTDAVEQAGPTSGADVNALNLAARLVDGQKIVVPAYDAPARILPGTEGAGGTESGPVDLNSATQAELETLPCIGPTRAKAIIEYRGAHPFRRVEDVMNVPGIGPGTFERIKDKITVR